MWASLVGIEEGIVTVASADPVEASVDRVQVRTPRTTGSAGIAEDASAGGHRAITIRTAEPPVYDRLPHASDEPLLVKEVAARVEPPRGPPLG